MEDGASSKKLIKGTRNTKIPSPVTSVLSNSDLFVQILLCLPVLSLILFKSVSKHWLKIITSPDFITSRSKIQNIDPPFVLLTQRINVGMKRLQYNFESFDIRIPSKFGFTLGLEAPLGCVEILQSCNGLLLCCIYPYKFYVFNPTINQFKMIPASSPVSTARLAFDPTKYKIIQPVLLKNDDDDDDYDDEYDDDDDLFGSPIQVHTYSSETDGWSVCGDNFRVSSFEGFKEGVYWNEAIHWLNINNVFMTKTMHSKLDIENEQPSLTKIELPVTFDGKSHFQSKMFESRGCLLLLGKDCAHSQQLNVYEMRNAYSEWSVKYIVNLDDIMIPFPRTWRIRPCVWSIVLGEREEDCFMIIDLLSKVVQYNPVLKTVHTLADLESMGSPLMVSNFDSFQFIASFAEV